MTLILAGSAIVLIYHSVSTLPLALLNITKCVYCVTILFIPSAQSQSRKMLASTPGCWLFENNQERIRGVNLPVIFNNVFDEFNFCLISNLFDNNNPYALSKHKYKKCEQNASYLVKNSDIG